MISGGTSIYSHHSHHALFPCGGSIYLKATPRAADPFEWNEEKEVLGRNGKFPMPKWSHKGIPNNQIGTKRGTKTSQGTFKETLAEQGRNSIEKGCEKCVRGTGFWKPFMYQSRDKSWKCPPGKHAKISHEKAWKIITTRCQNGAIKHNCSNLFEKGKFRQLSVLHKQDAAF